MLEETHLPLRKGTISNSRGVYSAFIVVMSPMNFLKLTTDEYAFRQIQDDVEDNYQSGQHAEYQQQGNYELPYLIIDYYSGKVIGHEGRHRAMMILKEGGSRFPCSIECRQPKIWEVKYYEYADDDMHSQRFTSSEKAREFRDSLYAANFDSIDELYDNITTEMVGGGYMRGSPRSKGWDYDAWTVADFPKFLESQFTSVKVPATAMRIGLVKGYSHFNR
jgi:hypothetical protein